ncbi:N-succinylarginine dihydrolase [Nitrococcus mobilis]|uniref:N-succinylarginine dihydrolase n=1 Tax=Nitrococcus mobilis Nb-231 TaxID=314278 RepID=A4BQG6_9GAMM|nr:N-succinylarginine dihydrolase [Nitrococcus mobilis]EAR21816.1 succinylarginine dihydrolase [Nitrococcus mobilis Nb-231]
MSAVEVNFDGLVGTTHNYAGLSLGNLASQRSAGAMSNPRAAAQQGLRKMKTLHDLGLRQAVLPPHERPAIDVLRRLGFGGSDGAVLGGAARAAPELLAACCSASSMWAANAATVSPSADTADGRVHLTPANLINGLHRAIEPPTTARVLRAIFADEAHFAHHAPLPAVEPFGDEGAANHTRLCPEYGAAGLELFVYGRSTRAAGPTPRRYPARQTLEASQAVARLHGLDPQRCVFVQQNPALIDAGVFHNDVIAVGNAQVLLQHEQAFLDSAVVHRQLQRVFGEPPVCFIVVPAVRISVAQAVDSYLFNSQLVTLPAGDMALVVPEECRRSPPVWGWLGELLEQQTPIRRVLVSDVRQSMRNGGGPACLRLRVVLTATELAAVNADVFLDESLFAALSAWIDRHYRDRLTAAELADPALLGESRTALDELTRILRLGPIYPFQLYGA